MVDVSSSTVWLQSWFVYKNDLLQHEVDMRGYNCANSILLPTEFLKSRGSFKTDSHKVVNCFKRNVTYTSYLYNIRLLWIPSHVSIHKYNHVDRLAKEAGNKGNVDIEFGTSR